MIVEVIQSRLKLHQDRADHIDYLMSNYGDSDWPGGEKKFKKDYYERMVLNGIIKELKNILGLQMNKDLILKLRNQAIENVSNKRKLSGCQIERTWQQDDFDIEFAGLVAKQCAMLAMHQHTSKSPEHYSELNEYDKGCDDTASAVVSNIRFCFGVKD